MNQQIPAFINAYNALVDQMSQKNQARLFWATDFASKNRFSCPLPDMLEELAVKGSVIQKPKNIRLKRVLGVFYHAFKIYLKMKKARCFLRRIDPQVRYTVVRTFLYNHSFDSRGNLKDVFWGQLPEAIKQQRPVLIYAMILGDYDVCLKKSASSGFLIIPLEAFLSFKDIVKALIEVLTTPVDVPSSVDFLGHEVSSLVKTCLHRTFKGVQMSQFVQFWSTTNLARQVRADSFYMTYENYPWERMTIMALRESGLQIRTVGYQHTVVPQAFLNYFVSTSEIQNRLLPDEVFTTGERPKEIMLQYSSAKPVFLQAACALRFEYLHTLSKSPRRKIKRVLLALEGSMAVRPVVESVFKQLAGRNDYTLRIRTHPLLPWSVFEKRLGLKLKAFDNVEVSQGALKKDLEWADTVVYYSTTVAMEALMMGKPVIHVHKDITVLSSDPLFECQALKVSLPCQSNLIKAFESMEAMNDEQFQKAQAQARAYLEAYFFPVSQQRLSLFSKLS